MTREDILRMADEAWDDCGPFWLTREQVFLERFAALVAAAEREACAKVCEDNFSEGALNIADAIRAGGQK